MKSKFTDTAADVGNGAMEVAKNIQSHAKSAWETVQQQTKLAVHQGIVLARKRPVSTALVACGVGLVAGFFIKRRAQPSLKDTVKPLRQSTGLLLGALLACGTFVKRIFFRASTKADKIGDHARRAVKKAKRVARKASRKSGSNGVRHARK